jgi:hypothetical protein
VLALVFGLTAGSAELKHSGTGHAAAGGTVTDVADVLLGAALIAEHVFLCPG